MYIYIYIYFDRGYVGYKGYIEFRFIEGHYPPMLKNQIDKTLDNETDTGA